MGAIENIHPMWTPIGDLFQISGEITSLDLTEITQTFSTSQDSFRMKDSVLGTMSFYWNYETNELFDIYFLNIGIQLKPICVRKVIEPTSETSTIQPGTLLIKPSVLLGYDNRNQINPIWGVTYNGTSRIREIPVNVFRSCFYVSDINATVSAAYYVSDQNMYHDYFPYNRSMILQIDVSVSSNYLLANNFYVYNIFHHTSDFDPNEMKQNLDTPEHIFCPERLNTLPLPNDLPEQMTFNQERILTTENMTIQSEFNVFDRIIGFTRLDSWMPMNDKPVFHRLIELDDFASGLRYQYDHQKKSCSINSITEGVDAVPVDSESNFLEMVDASQYFFRNNLTYQYIGEKKCADQVRCHAWIGESLSGDDGKRLRREWYWAFEFNGTPLTKWIPMRMKSTTLDEDDVPVHVFTTNLLNFEQNPTTLNGVDQIMVNCYRSMGQSHNFTFALIGFTIITDHSDSNVKNIYSIQNSIRETLAFLTQIRTTRISNIVINSETNGFWVMLTLLDAPPFVGSVEFPLKELPLDDVITRLRREIDANHVIIRVKNNDREVRFLFQANSLQIIYNGAIPDVNPCINQTIVRSEQIDECPNRTVISFETAEPVFETNEKSTGPLITGVWIGFVTLGFFIGMIGGTFILTKLSK